MNKASVERSNLYKGSPTIRLEDWRFLTGRGQYVADLQRSGQWFAAIVRSGVAHGEIRSIDTKRALAIAGVHAVLTSKDIGDIPRIPLRTTLPSFQPYAQPVIASHRVRYVGEPIAIVLAETAEIAEDAADTVEAIIDPLPAIVNWKQAIENNVLLIEGTKTNVAGQQRAQRGDADAAFRNAPFKIRRQFDIQRHVAMPMETRGVLADWDEKTSHLTLYGAAKAPFFNRKSLAGLLGMPEHAVDYIECDVGGGFGARGEVYPEDFLLGFASRKYNRPIKWIEDRREHFMAMNHARESHADLEIACELDGTLIGLRGTAYTDYGAYARPSSITPIRNFALFMAGAYRIPHVDLTSIAIVSNKTPTGVYRGPGRFESCFFFERILDIAAEALKLDRVEFRRRNVVTASEMPYKLATLDPSDSPSGALDSGHYPATLDACAQAFGWGERSQLSGKLIDGRYHGVGMACFVEGGAAGPRENARIEANRGGSVTVIAGSSSIGQGLETVLAQIAADELEIPIERFRVLHGSTNLLHEGFGSFASRATVMGGNAVVAASQAFLVKVREAAARRLSCRFDQISYAGGIASTPDGRSLSLAELAGAETAADGTFANSNATYTYGTAMAHVAVDPLTGHTELLCYQTVDDVGRAINPLMLHGQVIGGAVQGLGGVFSEELTYDEDGQLLVGSFVEYVTAVASDYPNIHAKTLEQYPSPHNPLGAKGAGEGGVIPVGGAVGNAVAAALAPLGVDVYRLPLTPARIWELIQNASSSRSDVS